MPATSDARIEANRKNAQKSTGPRTDEGKAVSRRNGLKHGMAGAGIVLIDEDLAEVERRHDELQAELAPKSAMGRILVRDLATQSVRMERAAREESAATAERVRHAVGDYDRDRQESADQLFESLADDPRRSLRKLRRSPDGVERLIEGWQQLRDELAHGGWLAQHRALLENLTGRKADAGYSRPGALAKAVLGDFSDLGQDDAADLDRDARREWARLELLGKVDAEVAALEAHYEGLNHEAFEQDRIEAPARALFDASKPACLARRYESEARRGFYRALRELRKAEAAAAEAGVTAATPSQAPASAPLGSSRERNSLAPRDPRPAPSMSRIPADEAGFGMGSRVEAGSRDGSRGRSAVA